MCVILTLTARKIVRQADWISAAIHAGCGMNCGTPIPTIPDEETLRVPVSHKVMPGEQLFGSIPHQEGTVGPIADQILVVEPLLQQHVDHAQGRSAVGTRPHRLPDVSSAPHP